MLTRNPYIRLILFLLMLLAFGGWMFYLALSASWYLVVPALGMLWAGYKIFGLFNRLHEKVAYFFNAVENEDSTLYFPEDIRHRPTKELHQGLNRMNRLIQEVKLRNHEQEKFYGSLLEQVATGIVVVNPRGNVLQANSAAKRLLGYQSLNHLDQLKRVDTGLHHAIVQLNQGASHQFVKIVQGQTITQLSLHATTVDSGREMLRIISIHDISHELETKELESWQRLIRVLTHEIMNSITPITSLSQTLLEYYSPLPHELDRQTAENTAKGLHVINDRSAGLMRFVDSYRTLTRLAMPLFKPVELDKLIDSVILLMQGDPVLQRVQLMMNAPKITVEADETQLSQVLINLLKNSLQAVEDTEQPRITIDAQQSDNGRCRISIEDNGHGIPPEQLDQIFIPFFTTRKNGSGIGLSLSRQIVQNHGGSINVISLSGVTQFIIQL